MFKLGEYQKLVVSSKTSSGYYLKTPDSTLEVDIFLPGNQVPEETEIGDEFELFVYRDSKDRLITTTRKPVVTLHKLALLKVVKASEFGAFLQWGLERDLFLPFSEQLHPVKKGEFVLIRVYIDKSERLCATMKIQKELMTHPDFKVGELHQATVYRINEEIGIFVAVEDFYDGLILKHDVFGSPEIGEKLELYISRIRDDGRLLMSFKKSVPLQIEDDIVYILDQLKKADGFLPYNDSSTPESIRSNFNMSKKAFKRALGRLYKAKQITILEDGIQLQTADEDDE